MHLRTDLTDKIKDLKKDVLRVTTRAGRGHVTSCFSCAELMVSLYYDGFLRYDPQNPKWEERDFFLLSKGHADALMYAVLADLGYFSAEDFETYCLEGGRVGPLLRGDVPGVEIFTGSLGCGLGIAVGLAMSMKYDRKDNTIFCMVGDAECEEGAIWEAAGLAAEQKLDNLIVIVDDNHMGAIRFTPTLQFQGTDGLLEKWSGFGFNTRRINGHDLEQVRSAYLWALNQSQPCAIIADTVKGHGVSFIENEPFLHGVAVSPNHLDEALLQVEKGETP